MPNRFLSTMAVILAVVFAAGSAPAQRVDPVLQLQGDIINLQGLVKDLRTSVTELQRSMENKNQNLQTLLERTVDRVNLMGGDVKAIQDGNQSNAQSGQANIERLARMLEESRAQDDKRAKDLAAAVQALSASMGVMNQKLTEQLAANLNDKTDKLNQTMNGLQLQVDALGKQIGKMAEDSHTVPLVAPEQLLRNAYADYSMKAYDLALEGFQEIVTKYPRHPTAAKAALFSGETYFAQGKWEQAITAYEFVLQNYMDQDSKITALYKKGLSLANLKQNQPAIDVFNLVIASYPDTTEAVNAAARVKELTPVKTTTPPARGATSPAPAPARGASTSQRGG